MIETIKSFGLGVGNLKRGSPRAFFEDIRLKWFFTYFIVLMLPLLISVLVFVQNGRVVEGQAKAIGMTALSNITQQFENWEDSCNTALYKVVNNHRLYQFLSETGKEENQMKLDLRHELEEYQKVGFAIGEICVYIPQKQWAVTSATSCNLEVYYQAMKREGYIGDFEAWSSVFGGHYKNDFVSVPTVYGQQLYYISSNDYPAGTHYFNVIVSLDLNHLKGESKSFFAGGGADYLILDADRQIVYSHSSKLDGSIGPVQSLMQEVSLGGKQYEAFFAPDILNGWTGVYAMPSESYTANKRLLNTSVLITVIWCLILGLIMIAMFVKRNYKPLSRILTKLADQDVPRSQIRGHEYAFIDESIQRVVQIKDRMMNRLDKQNKMVRSNLLLQLIKRGALRELPPGETLESYGIRFIGERFSIAMFFLEDITGLFQDDPALSNGEKTELAKYIIENVMSELTNEESTSYMLEMDDMQVCLVNINDEAELPKEQRRLVSQIKKGQDAVYEHFAFQFTAAVSAYHSGYTGIREAYSEALSAMEYRLVQGAGSLLEYERVARPDAEPDSNYLLDDSQKLINCIASGDTQRAERTVHAVIGRIRRGQPTIQAIKLLIFDLGKVLYQAVRLVSTPEEQDELRLLVDKMFECETLDEVLAAVGFVIETLCDLVNEQKETRQNATVKKVMNYVNEHYTDETLGVATIADAFHLTPNYLSHIFKAATNEKFLSYIHSVRIQKAKEILLREDGHTIETVARRVGYNNVSTFNRAFLKVEGIYPTKWVERKRDGGFN